MFPLNILIHLTVVYSDLLAGHTQRQIHTAAAIIQPMNPSCILDKAPNHTSESWTITTVRWYNDELFLFFKCSFCLNYIILPTNSWINETKSDSKYVTPIEVSLSETKMFILSQLGFM